MSVAIRSDQGTSESESLYSALQVSMEPSMVLNRNFVSSPRRKASLATPRSTNVAKRCSAGVITYLLATSFFGLAASRWFTDSEAPLLMIAFFSVGLIFLSGVSYPMELMPWYWKMAHYIIPAAPGTLAFIKLNSMGGNMADIRPEYITLWVQTVVYFGLAVWVYKKKLTPKTNNK